MWAALSAYEMRAFDDQYQRFFGPGRTEAAAWQDYRETVAQIRNDRQAMSEINSRADQLLGAMRVANDRSP